MGVNFPDRESISKESTPIQPEKKGDSKTESVVTPKSFWEKKDQSASKPLAARKIAPVKQQQVQETYKNEESLMGDPIKSLKKEDIINCEGYALVIDEVLDDMAARGETKEYTNPYTRNRLSEDEFNNILQHPKAKARIAEMNLREAKRPKDISEKTMMQIKSLAIVLSSYGKDLEEKEIGDRQFSDTIEAEKLNDFHTYYNSLPPKERKALDNLKIGFFTFQASYEDLQKGGACRREVAKDMWKTLAKHAPHLLPEEVAEKAKTLKGSSFDAFLHDYVPGETPLR